MNDIALTLRHAPPCRTRQRPPLKRRWAPSLPRQRSRWHAFLGSMPGCTRWRSCILACASDLPSLRLAPARLRGSPGLAGRTLPFPVASGRAPWSNGPRTRPCAAAFQGKDAALYRLQLTAIHDSYREGELCLRLTRDGQPLYLASFLFVPRADGVSLQLGALQGLRSEAGKLAVKEATRALHGCRPKNLMVAALRDFGDFFACNNLFLISNDNRIALNARRRRHIAADYDLAWQELHALRMRDGNYHLPCAPYRAPDLAGVPSRKRADARRRGELLKDMADGMRAQLADFLEAPTAEN